MADGFVDKVLDIITKSEKIGFAAAFAGSVFFAGRHYGFKPFTEVEQPMIGTFFTALSLALDYWWRGRSSG